MQDPTPSKQPRQPSSLACVTCRRRHLKCDAQMPVCGRCQASTTECRYIRSRRGLRTKNGTPHPQLLDDNEIALFPAIDPDAFPDWLSATTMASELVDTSQALFQPVSTSPAIEIPQIPDAALAWPEPDNAITPEIAYDSMIQLYYQSFHRSHPLLVPRKALHSSLCGRIPPYIISIMRFIGAHYHSDISLRELFRQSAYSVLSESTPRNGYKVQGMVLLAIIDHAHGTEDSANRTMQEAVNLALELGMNRAAYATDHSEGNSILEESWRRTFWELYCVDGYLAGMRDQTSFRLFHQKAEVKLPCDEGLYNSGHPVISSNQTLKDLVNSWSFNGDEQRFSSFAYRINAARLLGMVMELNRSLEVDIESQIEVLDASLVTSLMQLPSCQNEVYGASSLDEMTFQAEMTSYLALIYLHHPRSNMRFASIHAHTPCTRLPATTEPSLPSATLDLHSQKLLRAADMLSNLATLPNPVKYRTPFFTCALAMCVVVHTVACLFVPAPEKPESIKARIQLGVGALHVLGKIWPLAKTVRQRLINMYQEVGLRCP
ncbi:Zn(II)2Cys6 transcription factor [Aspergillus clavatus NRRL 1]|uniref:C6 transcription factor, putative n=1 Tax=Aspergillus clavatus (strain ATCC 1007 / CBS 513.65 / DSM 816 / NCTC 3887 / NRRL 1 / QM 1276 / 107) TaxID=344612 RepID=A1CDG5_ASPCL|nr:C6 transcription factor, putative [Aspergillus clavatus NRRL 1]EAW11892.1 C6 transcription factor, putative [Aspergillus clavatus NRRL 1]